MKRLSLNVWNEWREHTRGYVDLTLIHADADWMRGEYASASVVLLGFGASLTWYAKGVRG